MNINATLIVEMITFGVFVWFTMTFVWPPMVKALEKRRAKVAAGLAAAEKSEQALAEAQVKMEDILREAREQAAQILRQAEARAQAVMEDSRVEARKEAETIIVEAKQEIENEMRNARQEIRHELAGLALKAAGQVIRVELNDERHHQLVSAMIKEWR